MTKRRDQRWWFEDSSRSSRVRRGDQGDQGDPGLDTITRVPLLRVGIPKGRVGWLVLRSIPTALDNM